MDINEIEKNIITEFSFFEDWMDKYNYIIELGKSLPLIDPKYKTEQYLITGCQSQVWLHAEYKDGKVIYTADSDAVITKDYQFTYSCLSNRSRSHQYATNLY